MPLAPRRQIGLPNPPPPNAPARAPAAKLTPYEIPEGATAAQYAQKRFGGPTKIVETDITVGTTGVQLMLNNPRRIQWTMTNRGSSDVNFQFQRNFTAGQGFLLSATGGVAEAYVDEDGEETTYEITGISGSAGQIVHIVEVIRV